MGLRQLGFTESVRAPACILPASPGLEVPAIRCIVVGSSRVPPATDNHGFEPDHS